jgi:hypothetical protein
VECEAGFFKLGISPASIKGVMTFQSAASQPRRRTFFVIVVFCGLGQNLSGLEADWRKCQPG